MPTGRFDTSAVESKRHGRGKSDIFGTGRRSPGGLQVRVTSLHGDVHAQSASWAWFNYRDVRLDSDLNEMRRAHAQSDDRKLRATAVSDVIVVEDIRYTALEITRV